MRKSRFTEVQVAYALRKAGMAVMDVCRSLGISHWAPDILNLSSASVGVPYISAVPEPVTYAMLRAGLGLLGGRMRRT